MSLHSKRLIMLNKICGYLISQNYIVTKLDSYQPDRKRESSFNYFIWIGILNDNRIGLEKCHYEVLIDPNFEVHVMLHFEGAPKRYCGRVRNYFKKQNIGLTEVDPMLINSYTKKKDKDRWLWYKYMNNNSVLITSGNDSIPDCSAEISLNQLENIKNNLSDLIKVTKQKVETVLGIMK